jgi:hypothetical protein
MWRSGGGVGGLTAAHCLPEAGAGALVSSPSTVEILARLQNIIPYTNEGTNNSRINPTKKQEVEKNAGVLWVIRRSRWSFHRHKDRQFESRLFASKAPPVGHVNYWKI